MGSVCLANRKPDIREDSIVIREDTFPYVIHSCILCSVYSHTSDQFDSRGNKLHTRRLQYPCPDFGFPSRDSIWHYACCGKKFVRIRRTPCEPLSRRDKARSHHQLLCASPFYNPNIYHSIPKKISTKSTPPSLIVNPRSTPRMSSFLLRRALPIGGRKFSTSTARSSFAKMTIIGRLADTPELQATSTGQEILKYAVGTNSGPRDNQKTSWFRVTSFLPEGPQRDFIASLDKGYVALLILRY